MNHQVLYVKAEQKTFDCIDLYEMVVSDIEALAFDSPLAANLSFMKSIRRSLNNGLRSRNSWSELHSNCHSSHTLIHFCITFALLISVLHFISVQICFTSEPIIFQNFYSKSNFNYNFVQKILIVVKLLKIKFQQLLLL
jgi:hypothetical protein